MDGAKCLPSLVLSYSLYRDPRCVGERNDDDVESISVGDWWWFSGRLKENSIQTRIQNPYIKISTMWEGQAPWSLILYKSFHIRPSKRDGFTLVPWEIYIKCSPAYKPKQKKRKLLFTPNDNLLALGKNKVLAATSSAEWKNIVSLHWSWQQRVRELPI